MPDITDPQAISFANTKVRVMADLLQSTYWSAKAIVTEWNATSMSALIPNTADPIKDGANPVTGTADGRKPITGAKATSIITRAQEFITDYEASTNAKLNTVEQVSVNGEARF